MVAAKFPEEATVSLSAILNLAGEFATIRKTLRHLADQTIRARLEIVIVTTPGREALIDTACLESAGAWKVVTIPAMPTAAAGWAAGIREARAPLVVLCEDHSFPEPGWAEAIVEAHKEDCVAVAPAVCNGNPGSLVSWANFLLCFLEWYAPDRSGPVAAGPGHNTSYKRSALLAYQDLARLLNPERVLHFDFAAKRQSILLERRAATHHVNISLPRSYLGQSLLGGRVFGASRAAGWPGWRIALYALAFPLTPLVRLRRMFKTLDTPSKRRESHFYAALPWIVAGLICHAAGEAMGYISGPGDAPARYMDYETRRSEHVSDLDRHILADSTAAHA